MYKVSDAWGNEEVVVVPAGQSPGDVSAFARLVEILDDENLEPGTRACLLFNYNGRALFQGEGEPSVKARQALQDCGFNTS